jgi:hypothetical protein
MSSDYNVIVIGWRLTGRTLRRRHPIKHKRMTPGTRAHNVTQKAVALFLAMPSC